MNQDARSTVFVFVYVFYLFVSLYEIHQTQIECWSVVKYALHSI